MSLAYTPGTETHITRAYIARIPDNVNYTTGDISNNIILVSDISRKSRKQFIAIGKKLVQIMFERGLLTENVTTETINKLSDDDIFNFADRYFRAYDNVDIFAYEKYNDVTFQHDLGSFGTDNFKVFKV